VLLDHKVSQETKVEKLEHRCNRINWILVSRCKEMEKLELNSRKYGRNWVL
jgi:hypothetical protein